MTKFRWVHHLGTNHDADDPEYGGFKPIVGQLPTKSLVPQGVRSDHIVSHVPHLILAKDQMRYVTTRLSEQVGDSWVLVPKFIEMKGWTVYFYSDGRVKPVFHTKGA